MKAQGGSSAFPPNPPPLDLRSVRDLSSHPMSSIPNDRPHPDDQPSVAVVLLHWRNGESIARQIRDLAAWRSRPPIIVVENEPLSLPDDLRACAIGLAPAENLGYAGGVNLALREISRRGIAFALLLNADLECPETVLLQLLEAARQDPTIGLIGPLLEDRDANGRVQIFAGGRNPVWRPQTRRPATKQLVDPPRVVDAAYTPGTVCLLRMALLSTTGLMEDSYFFSGEIADLGRRARRAGYRCAVHTGARAPFFRRGRPAAGDALFVLHLAQPLPAGPAVRAGFVAPGVGVVDRPHAADRGAATRHGPKGLRARRHAGAPGWLEKGVRTCPLRTHGLSAPL